MNRKLANSYVHESVLPLPAGLLYADLVLARAEQESIHSRKGLFKSSANNKIAVDMEERIEVNPEIMVGKPVIKGTRIPVYLILDLMAAGYTPKDIIKEYPQLNERDIKAAIEYAASVLKREETLKMKA